MKFGDFEPWELYNGTESYQILPYYKNNTDVYYFRIYNKKFEVAKGELSSRIKDSIIPNDSSFVEVINNKIIPFIFEEKII